MPTNPHAGFYMVPVDLESDEDWQSLKAWERGVWWTILTRCYANREPWRHRGISLPAYSMITTYPLLAAMCQLNDFKDSAREVRRCVLKLKDRGWTDVTSVKHRYTVISLVKAPKWQDFATYRRKTDVTSEKDQCNERESRTITTTTTSSSNKPRSSSPKRAPKYTQAAVALAHDLRKTILSANPEHTCGRDGWKHHPWANVFQAALDEGHNEDRLRGVMGTWAGLDHGNQYTPRVSNASDLIRKIDSIEEAARRPRASFSGGRARQLPTKEQHRQSAFMGIEE